MKREDMKGIVELAFRKYEKERNNITHGFIKREHVTMVADSLHLKELKNEELNEMWFASHDYFDSLYCEFDEHGEIVGFKPYNDDMSFYRDTQSAWSEVINEEARSRRKAGLM